MSDILALYQRFRAVGCDHREAIMKVAGRLGVDRETARRVINRARADERRLR